MPPPGDLSRMVRAIDRAVAGKWSAFGLNKRQEVARLVFEISKRETIDALAIIRDVPEGRFEDVKRYLCRRRYPCSSVHRVLGRPYLPKLDIDGTLAVSRRDFGISPGHIYYEEAVSGSAMLARCRGLFPRASFRRINSLKEFCSCRRFTVRDYNSRAETFFLVRERFDFFKPCPCTNGAAGCGYGLVNLGFGCAFECAYCFLQEYQNVPGIVLPVNIDDFFGSFRNTRRAGGMFPYTRIGSGEFTDSLIFDHITGFSRELAEFFGGRKGVYFEFKTKSDNVGNLLSLAGRPNIVAAWSVNPPSVIRENEIYTQSLERRLSAAEKCARAGYSVAFHFDPIIHFDGWQSEYERVVDRIFDTVRDTSIVWISLGSLRFNPALKKIMENRFPANSLLDEELFPGFDEKMRYPEPLRVIMYRHILRSIRRRSSRVFVYLCMEDADVWRSWKA
jgi:spore photoproduct lyase